MSDFNLPPSLNQLVDECIKIAKSGLHINLDCIMNGLDFTQELKDYVLSFKKVEEIQVETNSKKRKKQIVKFHYDSPAHYESPAHYDSHVQFLESFDSIYNI